MKKDTQKRIEEYKAKLPGVKERIAAIALMLVVSIVMMTSASYAWLTISRAPEVKGMNTTISGNGNLEIALVNPEGTTPGNATGEESGLLSSNITWGNLVNLSDSSYGVDHIALRPALLSGYNRHSTPLYGASYDASGRVTSTSTTYSYATWKQAEDESWYFDAANPTYGVRAIASVTYENITGNAAANKLMQRARDAYSTARTMYVSLITNETLVSSEGVYPQIKSMDALTSILQIFVQDKANYYASKLGSGTYETADYSGVVTYMYRLAAAFQDVLEKEGEALLYLANLQAYLNGAESTETFADIDTLLKAHKAGTLSNYGVQLQSLTTFYSDYTEIAKAVNGLKPFAERCDPDTVTNPEKVEWNQISTYVNYLVDINTTTIAQDRNSETFAIGKISSDNLMDLLGILQNCQSAKTPADVVVSKGILYRMEQRLPSVSTDTLEGRETTIIIRLTVNVLMVNMNNTPVYARVRTTAAEPYISNLDEGTTASMENTGGNKGDAVANDTYGMAIDMWVRTNVSGVILTLEGSLVTVMEQEYGVDKNGDPVALYVITNEGESVEAYYLVEDDAANWYIASSHTLWGAAEEIGTLDDEGDPTAQSGYTIEKKMIEVVTGYDGVNRVWEDYLGLIEAGLMAENNTTQGGGSCYVFYADPSDQTRILHLLEAFTVVFVDQEGTTLGTAKLDTEHYYSINGKTTVPLQMVTGNASYTDEDGNYQLGITALNQNEATWVTALIYLDGQRLSNADVLAVGEIEGSLNIQFGSSVSLNNLDDEKLRNEYRNITATATSGGNNSTNSQQPISFEYDGNAREVTVTLLVEGEQPKKISAFFVRSISQSQGTRGETVAFTPNGDNTWSATFSLTKPGNYSLRNLIVDGSNYDLDDGVESGMDNFPTVKIEGLGIRGVTCTGLAPGVTMTADSYVTADVIASIDASADLMPKQVRALFRSSTGREFTALMSYDERQGNWSGTATITESGTYTLQYLVMDGQYTELDPEMQTTHIIYLGLTAQVWSTGVELEDGTYSNTFEFKGAVNIPMQVKLFDGAGNELKAMEKVWLFYHSEGSILDQDGMSGEVTWNASTGYYEGQLQLKSGGTFFFDRVVTNFDPNNPSAGNANTIRKATLAPTFTAYVTDPPDYVGHSTVSYQFVPNGGATMNVKLTNAQTSTMWAEIEDLTSGATYMVPCTSRTALDVDTNLYRFNFDWTAQLGENATQDGSWQLMALYMQGVAKPNADPNEDPVWTPVTDGEPTADNSYMIDLSGESITAYVVQTVNIAITDSAGNEYTGEVFGATDANGNKTIEASEITGTFMQSHNAKAVTVTVKDWDGKAIQADVGITWQSTHQGDSADKGGYTGAYQNPPAVDLTGSGTTYTLASQTFQMAGSYTSKFTVTVGGVTTTVDGPNYEVWSKAPTVTVTGVTNTGSINTQISWTVSGRFIKSVSYTYSNPNGLTSRVDTTNNEVWAYAAASADGEGCGNGDAGFTRPQVTFAVAGVDSASTVTFTIPAGAANALSFSCTGNGSKTLTLGTANTKVNEVSSIVTYTCFGYRGHGDTVEISEVKVTRDGVTYTVNLEKPIIIHNPSSVDKT